MMLKTITNIIVFVILFTVNVYADTGDVLIDGPHTYKAIKITPTIYNNSNQNLSDILILDENKKPVPYFINSYKNTEEYSNNSYPLNFISFHVKDNDYFSDYFIPHEGNSDLLATSISLNTKETLFTKTIRLMGSFDGVNWEFIKTDNLYRVDNNEKLTIEFDKPLKYNYYRFILPDSNIVFDNVLLKYDEVVVNMSFFIETLIPKFEQKQEDRTTIIELFGLKNVKINEITFESDDQFKRTFSFNNGEKTLYNLIFENSNYRDTILKLNGYTEDEDSLKIRIDNGDDTPIKIKNVIVSYFADEVVFKAENKFHYKILYNDKSVVAKPVYDMEKYKHLILQEGYDILPIYNIEVEAVADAPKPKDYSIAFNVVVTISSLILFFIVLSNMKRSKSH